MTWNPGSPSISGLETLLLIQDAEMDLDAFSALIPTGLEGPAKPILPLHERLTQLTATHETKENIILSRARESARLAVSLYISYLELPVDTPDQRLLKAFVSMEIVDYLRTAKSKMVERQKQIDFVRNLISKAETYEQVI